MRRFSLRARRASVPFSVPCDVAIGLPVGADEGPGDSPNGAAPVSLLKRSRKFLAPNVAPRSEGACDVGLFRYRTRRRKAVGDWQGRD